LGCPWARFGKARAPPQLDLLHARSKAGMNAVCLEELSAGIDFLGRRNCTGDEVRALGGTIRRADRLELVSRHGLGLLPFRGSYRARNFSTNRTQ
jgi:hypothetical protein